MLGIEAAMCYELTKLHIRQNIRICLYHFILISRAITIEVENVNLDKGSIGIATNSVGLSYEHPFAFTQRAIHLI